MVLSPGWRLEGGRWGLAVVGGKVLEILGYIVIHPRQRPAAHGRVPHSPGLRALPLPAGHRLGEVTADLLLVLRIGVHGDSITPV